jgi:hypothetical protein
LKAHLKEEEAAFTLKAEILFALITRKLGRAKAEDIFKAATGSFRHQTEERLAEDVALGWHCLSSKSPNKTAKRAIELGLRGQSEEAVLKRVQRAKRAILADRDK